MLCSIPGRLFTCLLLGPALSTFCAQQTINYASLSVRVADPSGGLVGEAQVSVRQTETEVLITGVTDREGRLHFPYLSVGPYEVTVRHQGFAPSLGTADPHHRVGFRITRFPLRRGTLDQCRSQGEQCLARRGSLADRGDSPALRDQ